MSTWQKNPDLMERLIRAQNALATPIDIVSFAGMCDSREELEAHVLRYESEGVSRAMGDGPLDFVAS